MYRITSKSQSKIFTDEELLIIYKSPIFCKLVNAIKQKKESIIYKVTDIDKEKCFLITFTRVPNTIFWSGYYFLN